MLLFISDFKIKMTEIPIIDFTIGLFPVLFIY